MIVYTLNQLLFMCKSFCESLFIVNITSRETGLCPIDVITTQLITKKLVAVTKFISGCLRIKIVADKSWFTVIFKYGSHLWYNYCVI